jgi:hypothetical protein
MKYQSSPFTLGDPSWHSLYMPEAFHRQTFLACGLNGRISPHLTALGFISASRASSATRACIRALPSP